MRRNKKVEICPGDQMVKTSKNAIPGTKKLKTENCHDDCRFAKKVTACVPLKQFRVTESGNCDRSPRPAGGRNNILRVQFSSYGKRQHRQSCPSGYGDWITVERPDKYSGGIARLKNEGSSTLSGGGGCELQDTQRGENPTLPPPSRSLQLLPGVSLRSGSKATCAKFIQQHFAQHTEAAHCLRPRGSRKRTAVMHALRSG